MASINDQQLGQYRQIQIETSTTLDLVRLAYDGIITNLEQAIEALKDEQKSYDVFNDKITTAQQIISALDDGLDEEQGEIAEILADFYRFVRRKLIDSNMSKSASDVEEILTVVRQVGESWYSSEAMPEVSTDAQDSEKKSQINLTR